MVYPGSIQDMAKTCTNIGMYASIRTKLKSACQPRANPRIEAIQAVNNIPNPEFSEQTRWTGFGSIIRTEPDAATTKASPDAGGAKG